MIVAVIGHRNIEKTKKLEIAVERAIIHLIEYGADTFLFGSRGQFDDLCYRIVTKLKNEYSIKRVYIRAAFQFIDNRYKEYLLSMYEETIFPKSVIAAGRLSYIKRNEAMIDMCDILLTYYDRDYIPITKEKSNSGTAIAFRYALNKKRDVINVLCKNK